MFILQAEAEQGGGTAGRKAQYVLLPSHMRYLLRDIK
jgi:hypothetical protein